MGKRCAAGPTKQPCETRTAPGFAHQQVPGFMAEADIVRRRSASRRSKETRSALGARGFMPAPDHAPMRTAPSTGVRDCIEG
jgi:hypothetical protein